MWKHLLGTRLESGYGSATTAEEVANDLIPQSEECTVIITGANDGIGKETALQCAKSNVDVIMMGRNPTTLASAVQEVRNAAHENASVFDIVMDLCDFDSVRNAANEVRDLELRKPLKILLNNAGVMMHPREVIDGVELHMRTNFFGHFLLTNELLPILEQNAPSRVINVGSEAYHFAEPCMGLDDLSVEGKYVGGSRYGASKLANALHATDLAERLEGTGVQAVSLHPGMIPATKLGRHLGRLYDIFGFIVSPISKSIAQGAATSIYCAFAPELQSGGYYADCCLLHDKHNVQNRVTKHVRTQLFRAARWHTLSECPFPVVQD
ncbi:MAG: hypothetical protein MHM6MM_006273 [Cercozoa sp. M6MM]